jgi:hypothetical protein
LRAASDSAIQIQSRDFLSDPTAARDHVSERLSLESCHKLSIWQGTLCQCRDDIGVLATRRCLVVNLLGNRHVLLQLCQHLRGVSLVLLADCPVCLVLLPKSLNLGKVAINASLDALHVTLQSCQVALDILESITCAADLMSQVSTLVFAVGPQSILLRQRTLIHKIELFRDNVRLCLGRLKLSEDFGDLRGHLIQGGCEAQLLFIASQVRFGVMLVVVTTMTMSVAMMVTPVPVAVAMFSVLLHRRARGHCSSSGANRCRECSEKHTKAQCPKHPRRNELAGSAVCGGGWHMDGASPCALHDQIVLGAHGCARKGRGNLH